MRLDRIISKRGGYSRKIATKMIRAGRVQVDGILCKDAKTHFSEESLIEIDGHALRKHVSVYVYHKPSGMLSTTEDPMGRPCVGDVLPHRYHIVGRLDMETRGLLLLSSDGALSQRLLHPKRAVEREYLAWVEGSPTLELKTILSKGVETSLGMAHAQVCSVEGNCVRLVVTEGRNRIVRRMLHNAGHSVLDLQRIRFGPVLLDELEEGWMEPISQEQEKALYAI